LYGDGLRTGLIQRVRHTECCTTAPPLPAATGLFGRHGRVKTFLWLALRRRHWAANRRARHGLEARDTCFLCDQDQETIDHIIAACPFTRELWHHILQALGLQLPAGTASSLAWWQRIRSLTNVQWRKGLDTRDLLWSLGRFGKSVTPDASATPRQQSSSCSSSSRWRPTDGLKRAPLVLQN